MKNNNKGLTLVELLVSGVILSIVMVAIFTFLSVVTGYYGRQTSDLALQEELQTTFDYVSNLIMPADSGGVSFASDTLVVKKGANKTIVKWSDDKLLVYKDVIVGEGELLSEYVDTFDVEIQSGYVVLEIVMKNTTQTAKLEQNVYMRNVAGIGGILPGELPTDELPTDELPTDELPTGELPTDELPTDELPTDELPTDELPTGELPTGEIPTGELPTGSINTTLPPGAALYLKDLPAGTITSYIVEIEAEIVQNPQWYVNPCQVDHVLDANVSGTWYESKELKYSSEESFPQQYKSADKVGSKFTYICKVDLLSEVGDAISAGERDKLKITNNSAVGGPVKYVFKSITFIYAEE